MRHTGQQEERKREGTKWVLLELLESISLSLKPRQLVLPKLYQRQTYTLRLIFTLFSPCDYACVCTYRLFLLGIFAAEVKVLSFKPSDVMQEGLALSQIS